MQLIVGVCPMGYAAEFLAADPNLAEGMPVRDAAFVVKGGKLVPFDETTTLVNGSLEEWKKRQPGRLERRPARHGLVQGRRR